MSKKMENNIILIFMLFYIFLFAILFGFYRYVTVIFKQNANAIQYLLKPQLIEMKNELMNLVKSSYKRLTLDSNVQINTTVVDKMRKVYNSIVTIISASRENMPKSTLGDNIVCDISYTGPIKDSIGRHCYVNLYTNKRIYPDKYKVQNMVQCGTITIDSKKWNVVYMPVEKKGILYVPVVDKDANLPNYTYDSINLHPIVNSTTCSYVDNDGKIVFTTRRKQLTEFIF